MIIYFSIGLMSVVLFLFLSFRDAKKSGWALSAEDIAVICALSFFFWLLMFLGNIKNFKKLVWGIKMNAKTGKYCYGIGIRSSECEFTVKCARCDFALMDRFYYHNKKLIWPTVHMEVITLPPPSFKN